VVKKDLLSIYDLSAGEIKAIVKKAIVIKNKNTRSDALGGKTLGILLEKPSTRTAVSFAVAAQALGCAVIFLNAQEMQLLRGESIADTAKVLSFYLSALVIRTQEHCRCEEFAKNAQIPVINGLTDFEHPCQILADIMTIIELVKIKTFEALRKLKIVYVGCANNVSNSLLGCAAILGLDLTLVSPKYQKTDEDALRKALAYALSTGAEIKITSDVDATSRADVIYTDAWTSMGQTPDKKKNRDLQPYQVNEEMLKKASATCAVLHCMPIVRGEEITPEVADRCQDSILAAARNRMYLIKKADYLNATCAV
jgi:ornithine carbamoyltransferase